MIPRYLLPHNPFWQGLLVAACVNRALEGTFGAAVAEVGVLDLLKVIA
jgi:hypothetical protein